MQIAQDFRLDAQPVLASQQKVERIAFRQFPARVGGLAIGGGRDDEADERFAA